MMEVPFCAETGFCGAGRDSQPLLCFLLASWAACSQACGEVALVWPFLEEGGHQSWLSGKHGRQVTFWGVCGLMGAKFRS